MTKKNFIALAEVIRNLRPEPFDMENNGDDEELAEHSGKAAQYRKVTLALADFCSTQNPNFNRERFLAACGVE